MLDIKKLIAWYNDVLVLDATDYGVNFNDISGNIIELWQPFSEAYIKMVKKEIIEYNSNRKEEK